MSQESGTIWLAPIGRLLLSVIFIMSGIGKLRDWDATAKHMEDAGVQHVEIALPIAVSLELGGALLILIGLFTRIGALALILFLIPVTIVMHGFWKVEGVAQMPVLVQFLKNTAILGGLFVLAAYGAGPLSIDAMRKRRPQQPA